MNLEKMKEEFQNYVKTAKELLDKSMKLKDTIESHGIKITEDGGKFIFEETSKKKRIGFL